MYAVTLKDDSEYAQAFLGFLRDTVRLWLDAFMDRFP